MYLDLPDIDLALGNIELFTFSAGGTTVYKYELELTLRALDHCCRLEGLSALRVTSSPQDGHVWENLALTVQ